MTKHSSHLADSKSVTKLLGEMQDHPVNGSSWHTEVLDRTTGQYRKTRQTGRANGHSNGQASLNVIEGRDKALVTEIPAGRDAVYFMALWLCGNWPNGATEARTMLDKQFPSTSESDRGLAVETYCGCKGP